MMPNNGEATGRSTRSGPGIDLSWDDLDRTAGDRQPVDWTKRTLLVGLGALSWVATYVGMLELIEANMGELPLAHKVIIGCSVVMLMVMIIWLLDQIFKPIGWTQRFLFVVGYLFLTVISVGFGFGFYWKVLESRSVASASASGAVGQVQTSLFTAQTRLEQLQGTLEQLVAVSRQKADLERASGTSCPASRPGDGPRRRLREDDAQRFGFAADLVKNRVGTVKGELGALDGDLLKIAANDASTIDARTGTRNEFMKGLSRKLDMTVAGFNAFRTDPQIRQIRSDLAERADRTTFPDGKGGSFQCPDQQLQGALRGVIRAIDELPSLERPRIAAVEGSEAVIEAFRRLTTTVYGALSFKLPPSAEEVRELQRKAIEASEAGGQRGRAVSPAPTLDSAGLSKRDYIPLAIAVFVDLCLLLVSIGRGENRLGGLVPRMREAERGPVIQILSRFNQIHRDVEIRENFEIFRHVVFDFNGDYYVAVPLDAPPRMNPEQREELRLEASLLANLFASFEQERLFSRVLMPMLPMASIRKRLRRQGSKFAEAEAFRVYKFRSGAWSEIILGAVMGAARRVEADKRRRRVEDEVFRPSETPTLVATRPGDSARGTSRQGETIDTRRDVGGPVDAGVEETGATSLGATRARGAARAVPEALTAFAGGKSGPQTAPKRARSYRRSETAEQPLAEASVVRAGHDGFATLSRPRPAAPVATGETSPEQPPASAPELVEQFGRYARFMREAEGEAGDDVERAPVASTPMPGRRVVSERTAASSHRDRAEVEPLSEAAGDGSATVGGDSAIAAGSAARSNAADLRAPADTQPLENPRSLVKTPTRAASSNVIVLATPVPVQASPVQASPGQTGPAHAAMATPVFAASGSDPAIEAAPPPSSPVMVAATERTVTFTLPSEQFTTDGGPLGALARGVFAASQVPIGPADPVGSFDPAGPAASASEGGDRDESLLRRPGPPPLPVAYRAPPAADPGATAVRVSSEPEEEDAMTLAARRFAPRIPAE